MGFSNRGRIILKIKLSVSVIMNEEYVQNLRHKLEKRIQRLNSANSKRFHSSLKQFWSFIGDNPIFMDILSCLGNLSPSSEEKAEKIMKGEALFGENEIEQAAISYFLIKKCAESNDDNYLEARICEKTYGPPGAAYDDLVPHFNDYFTAPFYEYLDEQLNDQRAILALLKRYKHKCEWFQREKLFELWGKETKKGERNLARHLYEYLYDQGLDFTIEPSSISGEADLVAAQNSEDPLIADTKIFNPKKSKGKTYIVNGFKQVYTYTRDYNEPFGYLIIYKTSNKDLKLALSNQTQSTPYVNYNNKTIFIIVIDIFPHENTASKRGSLEPTEITEDDLINISKE